MEALLCMVGVPGVGVPEVDPPSATNNSAFLLGAGDADLELLLELGLLPEPLSKFRSLLTSSTFKTSKMRTKPEQRKAGLSVANVLVPKKRLSRALPK